MKWVFPDKGNAFVSVIWAGMVGAVTGVNEHGLYVSLNAAGSTDFSRYGVPSTLVLLKALQFAKSVDEAVSIIRNAQMFITDIFVVADAETGKLFRIEKSPRGVEVIAHTTGMVVANHLLSPRWARDRVNVGRRDQLTSGSRVQRGQRLIRTLGTFTEQHESAEGDGRERLDTMLSFLRDKGEVAGDALELGNRQAIDALIATHSIIYNTLDRTLYVSQGPAVSGSFTGFDLTRSFEKRYPVVIGTLPSDQRVPPKVFFNVRAAERMLRRITRLTRKKMCESAAALLNRASALENVSYNYYAARGDVEECRGDIARARQNWKVALSKHPAYQYEIRNLQAKLSR